MIISGNIAKQLFWKKKYKKFRIKKDKDLVHKFGIYLPNHLSKYNVLPIYIQKNSKK